MRDRREIAGWLLVGASLVYLWMFMPRGWVPHDEGTIAQSAVRILLGNLPHVDYQEPYTGGLSLLHAAVFKVLGVDLVHLRWVLFAAFAAVQLLIYVILRRFLEPIGAALVAMLSLTWSFPNYFASLPSWWVLLCAIVCVWAFIRYTESGSLRFAAAAGLAAGLSIAFKQTGLYILVALVMAFLYGRGHRVVRIATALGSVCLAMAILKIRMTSTESIYLLLPIVACGILLGASEESDSDHGEDAHRAGALAVLCASLPLVAGLIPYLRSGQLEPLINGLFILPQKRLQFASLPMTQVGYILLGIPCVALVMPIARRIHLTTVQFVLALAGLSVVAAIAIVVSLRSLCRVPTVLAVGPGVCRTAARRGQLAARGAVRCRQEAAPHSLLRHGDAGVGVARPVSVQRGHLFLLCRAAGGHRGCRLRPVFFESQESRAACLVRIARRVCGADDEQGIPRQSGRLAPADCLRHQARHAARASERPCRGGANLPAHRRAGRRAHRTWGA